MRKIITFAGLCCLLCYVQIFANTNASYLFSPVTDESPYHPEPLPDDIPRITVVTTNDTKNILEVVDSVYQAATKESKIEFENPLLERLIKFIITFDTIKQVRYQRGATRLTNQKEFDVLYKEITESRWYKEFIVKATGNPEYAYSENRFLRTFITLHTTSHFYQLPYPSFFCLLFQESKFDFKISSSTGAIGIGQLTRIAIKQIELIRRDPSAERLLYATITHLRNIYRDPVILEVLKSMGFQPHFPQFEKLPKKVLKPQLVDTALIHEVSRNLIKMGHAYGRKTKLIKKLVKRVNRGDVLPDRYAIVHLLFTESIEKRYGNSFGNALNIETNIILSAILLNYYESYPWRISRKKMYLDPSVRIMAAIAAYNQGQAIVNRIFSRLHRDYPNLDLNEITVDELQPMLTAQQLRKSMKLPYRQVRELHRHIWKIQECAHK